MATPHKCPVCNGLGTITTYTGTYTTSTTNISISQCNACKGSGVVWEQEPIQYLPVYPIEIPFPYQEDYTRKPYFDEVCPLDMGDLTNCPNDVKMRSKDKLIETLKTWIEELEKQDE